MKNSSKQFGSIMVIRDSPNIGSMLGSVVDGGPTKKYIVMHATRFNTVGIMSDQRRTSKKPSLCMSFVEEKYTLKTIKQSKC